MQEARKLKSSHENVELLKEKLLEEKNRREKAESNLLKLSDIQLSAKKLEDELSSWKSMMKDIPGLTCANEIPIKFASLQKFVSDLVWFHFCTPPPPLVFPNGKICCEVFYFERVSIYLLLR